MKGDKISAMVRSIPTSLPESMQEAAEKNDLKLMDISQLQIGENPKSFVCAKVLCTLEKQTDVPQCFLMIDSKSNFYVVSVYHLAKGLHDKVRAGSELLIRNPHLVVIQLQFKGYQYNYQCVKVTDVTSLLVDGQNLEQKVAKSEVVQKTFS